MLYLYIQFFCHLTLLINCINYTNRCELQKCVTRNITVFNAYKIIIWFYLPLSVSRKCRILLCTTLSSLSKVVLGIYTVVITITGVQDTNNIFQKSFDCRLLYYFLVMESLRKMFMISRCFSYTFPNVLLKK